MFSQRDGCTIEMKPLSMDEISLIRMDDPQAIPVVDRFYFVLGQGLDTRSKDRMFFEANVSKPGIAPTSRTTCFAPFTGYLRVMLGEKHEF